MRKEFSIESVCPEDIYLFVPQALAMTKYRGTNHPKSKQHIPRITMGGHPELFWASLGAMERNNTVLSDCRAKYPKRRGLGGLVKLDLFLDRFWGPGGRQEGSHIDGSSIFTFAAGPRKGSKIGGKMDPCGHPKRHFAHLGLPFARK